MNIEHGVERGGTPIGDRDSLVKLAAEINERERQIYLQKKKLWEQQQKQRANNAQNV